MNPKIRPDYELIPTLASLENYEYMAHSERKKISHEIRSLMNEDTGRLFDLFNFLIIGLDRAIDNKVKPPQFLLHLKEIINAGWNAYEKTLEYEDDYEKVTYEFGQVLGKLNEEVPQARYIFDDFNQHLDNEYENALRRGKTLTRDELIKIKRGASEPFLSAIYQIVSFNLTREDTTLLAEKYGLPGIEADWLVDVAEDLELDIINVSAEDMEYLEGTSFSQEYYSKKLAEIKSAFQEGDAALGRILPRLPEVDQRKLNLLRNLLHTWIEDAENFVSVELPA